MKLDREKQQKDLLNSIKSQPGGRVGSDTDTETSPPKPDASPSDMGS
jgi:hypothetical protein